jgi:non-homologous end joining protein Ku
MLEDDELDAVALESTRTIDIDCFVPAHIEAKQKHARRSTKRRSGAKGGNVIDLMAVLKKSLQGGLPQRR